MPPELPPATHGGDDPTPRQPLRVRFRRSLLRFGVAALLLAGIGLAAGVTLGRAQPDRAARLVVDEFVVTEDADPGEAGPDPVVPTSGPQRGTPVCGWLDEPLSPPDQVRTLASGVVLIQHGPPAGQRDLEVLRELARRDRVAVAPNPAMEEAVVATSWRQRMPLRRADRELLDAFVTGHSDRAPDVRTCP